ncbi:MAG: pyridoxal phosphate-dependent aminotransferase [Bryobacter sp.]|nr:pyridoxal phosphate-dependent aminotransferase [Bryobacter sp.]
MKQNGRVKQAGRLKFSQRYPWSAPPNRLTEALRASPGPTVDLSISNPTRVGLPVPESLWENAASSEYRPTAQGDTLARAAIANYYAEEFGLAPKVEDIVLSASTSEAYSYCLKLLADPGEEVLVPSPSYPLLEHLVRAEGLVPVPYAIHAVLGDWILDREHFASRVNSRTRAAVVVHPNNPTGHLCSEDDFEWMHRALPPNAAILADEVFLDYVWEGKAQSFAGRERTFALSGLSKICLLPQMKLGWIVLPPTPGVREAMEFVADTYLSVSAPIAAQTPQWLARRMEFQAPLKRRCLKNRAHFPGLVAGWTGILSTLDTGDEEAALLRFLQDGYWAHPGHFYDLPFRESYVFSLLSPPEQLSAGLAVLRSYGK